MQRFPCFAGSSRTALSLSIGLLLGIPAVVSADPLPIVLPASPPEVSRAAASPRLAVPRSEPESAESSLVNPFTSSRAAAPNATGQTLVAPVTVNATTSADGLTVNQSGAGRAISGVISNAKSTISALKGTTNGGAAALAGQNTGTTGPAGQFQITNTASSQAGLVSSTTGTGNAIQAIQGSTGNSDVPAILGQHISGPANVENGVEGDGNYIGVLGAGGAYGVYGYSSGAGEHFGVYGESYKGYGIVGYSQYSYAGYYGPVYITGTVTAQSYATTSDRNVKQAIRPIDTESVLDRVAAMPISSWDFQTQPGIHHLGPMAQDFHAAFGLGADDKHIDLVDGIGVSLAAIQELQREVKSKDALSVEQQARIGEQQARIGALEASTQAVDAELAALRRAIDARLVALEQHPASPATASVRP